LASASGLRYGESHRAALESAHESLHRRASPAVQIAHWFNVIAIFLFAGSGWHIYDNVPVFAWLTFPK